MTKYLASTILVCGLLSAQTRIDLSTQSKNNANLGGDLSGQTNSATVVRIQGKPVSSTAPSTGQALVWNGSLWNPQGVSTMASQLGDFQVVQTSSTVLTICPNCSAATPAIYRFGGFAVQVTAPVTVTVSSGTDYAYIYIVNGSGLTVATPSLTLACGAGIACVSGNSIPDTAIPISIVHAASGTWNAVTVPMDYLSPYSTRNVYGANGTTCSSASGDITCSADQTVLFYRVAVPGSPTAACTAGNYAMDSNYLYVCEASGSWEEISWIPKVSIYTVSTLPTCNAGAQGLMAGVSDASSPAFLGALTGGGSTHAPAYCNGTNWVAY